MIKFNHPLVSTVSHASASLPLSCNFRILHLFNIFTIYIDAVKRQSKCSKFLVRPQQLGNFTALCSVRLILSDGLSYPLTPCHSAVWVESLLNFKKLKSLNSTTIQQREFQQEGLPCWLASCDMLVAIIPVLLSNWLLRNSQVRGLHGDCLQILDVFSKTEWAVHLSVLTLLWCCFCWCRW